jgi:hypothetical protein
VSVPRFLDDLRAVVKDGSFRPLPVRERKIPKPGGSGKVRKLGIPTIADRVVQAALKLVLEPIFEADFLPVSGAGRSGTPGTARVAFRNDVGVPPDVAALRGLASRPVAGSTSTRTTSPTTPASGCT